LLSARLADQIDQKLQQGLPLSTIFTSPTIKQLAQILRQNNLLDRNLSLVEIQPKGSQIPLFLFEGVAIYHPLISYLGLDRPIYGLVTLLKQGVNGSANQIENLASYYISELVKIQPEGPYYLGGLSFGGIVAFEVAQQLAARGQETRFVFMFDAMLPSAYKPVSLYQRLRFHSKKVAQQGLGYIINLIIDRTRELVDRITLLASNKISQYFKQKEQKQSSCTVDYLMMDKWINEAEAAYVPKPYHGKVIMFRAMDSEERESANLDPDLGWKPYLKDGMTIYDVPGDHLGILQEPNVGEIGNRLKLLMQDSR
jgi:aspartate racemase